MDSQLTIIKPSGHVNASNAYEFQRQLTTAVVSKPSSVLVDMHQVESIDSAGLMALISAFRMAKIKNQRFFLCSLSPSIRIIFELTQLERVFEIFESYEAFPPERVFEIFDLMMESATKNI